jgi:integrase/recombinase XerD
MDSSTHQRSLDSMAEEVISFYKRKNYSPQYIQKFRRHVELIRQFIAEKGFSIYSATECEQFIREIIGNGEYKHLSTDDKSAIRCANVLVEYHLTGMIPYRIKNTPKLLHGRIGESIHLFLEYRRARGFSPDTISENRIYLSRFYKYLDAAGRKDLSELSQADILGFIKVLSFSTKATIHCTLSSLRVFLRYLVSEGILSVDWSYLVPKDNYKKEAKLPTTYTEEEIQRMLSAVDRGNPKGKRDYAMLLLACRLGLRASDICGLTFDNLLWPVNIIAIIQTKTKNRIELPLLAEVGNAINDYLKYGCPMSQLSHVFLHANNGDRRLQEPTLHSIVSFYLRRAGIADIEKKKHGPHALRHSLAGLLLQKQTPLPVISEVLGHASTESTKTYLRIDMKNLSRCVLEVPPVDESYYMKSEVINHG